MVGEADDAEEDGEEDETHQLNGFAADGVNGCDGDPVSRNGASANDDQIADRGVAEDVVNVRAACIADCGQDDGVVEAQAVEGDIARGEG